MAVTVVCKLHYIAALNFSIMRYLLLLLLTVFGLHQLSANSASPVRKIQPEFWWTGMKNKEVQILLYGDSIARWNASVDYPGVSVSRIEKTENANYLFVYLLIDASAKAGDINIRLTKGKKKFLQPFRLLERMRDPLQIKGFDASDFIYLLMPDRFSNGDTTNDVIPGMLESKVDRSNPGGRHGGDLQGIINHLDYIKELGATAIWINPVLENNQPAYSYHGYAATDLYKVDARFGTNEMYVQLVAKAHASGMKVIKDVIYNHVGNENFIIKDPVSKSWVHQWDTFTRCNYRPSALVDPYASAFDLNLNNSGWFDHHMPDLDQTNHLLADYLIQNTIWWIEYSGIDGLRIDTYPYPENSFMNDLVREVSAEYPNINMVGEVWDQTVPNVAWYQKGSPINKEGSELESVFDFNLFASVRDGLKESFGWTTGTRRIYYTLAQDGLYGDPFGNVTFLDNHDLSRIYSEFGQDFNKWKQAIAILLTMRGIPCMYYGTELLFTGFTNPDGLVRQDFPGGWLRDTANKFIEAGRTPREHEAFTYVKKLADFRKAYPVVQTGKLMQFVPDDDVYVYFRYDDKNCVMVAINTSKEVKKIDSKRFAERMTGYTKGFDVTTGGMYSDLSNLTVDPKGVMIWRLSKD